MSSRSSSWRAPSIDGPRRSVSASARSSNTTLSSSPPRADETARGLRRSSGAWSPTGVPFPAFTTALHQSDPFGPIEDDPFRSTRMTRGSRTQPQARSTTYPSPQPTEEAPISGHRRASSLSRMKQSLSRSVSRTRTGSSSSDVAPRPDTRPSRSGLPTSSFENLPPTVGYTPQPQLASSNSFRDRIRNVPKTYKRWRSNENLNQSFIQSSSPNPRPRHASDRFGDQLDEAAQQMSRQRLQSRGAVFSLVDASNAPVPKSPYFRPPQPEDDAPTIRITSLRDTRRKQPIARDSLPNLEQPSDYSGTSSSPSSRDLSPQLPPLRSSEYMPWEFDGGDEMSPKAVSDSRSTFYTRSTTSINSSAPAPVKSRMPSHPYVHASVPARFESPPPSYSPPRRGTGSDTQLVRASPGPRSPPSSSSDALPLKRHPFTHPVHKGQTGDARTRPQAPKAPVRKASISAPRPLTMNPYGQAHPGQQPAVALAPAVAFPSLAAAVRRDYERAGIDVPRRPRARESFLNMDEMEDEEERIAWMQREALKLAAERQREQREREQRESRGRGDGKKVRWGTRRRLREDIMVGC